MPEPTREQIAQDYAKALAIINVLRSSNAELLAALRAVVAMYGPSSDYGSPALVVWQQAEAAITKAERR